ncbi:MAG TPA: DNA primase [Acidimicrobiales bacterium]|nr:DNA primase [Acidimicrobiales bacterium]
MAISEEDIAQVRAATDIVALISEHVALKKTGRRWSGLCPFHGEKTPSFSVNAEEGRYYCFGCRASGDAITFVREIQHLDFIDALRQLAERAGIELHEDANATKARRERQELLATMESAVEWYHQRLLTSPDARPARDYLRSRGIDGDVARRFRLGWAPDEWDALTKALNLSERQLMGTGLGFVNKRERRQDALRARIIFPIFDTSGKAIAVGGRILPPAPGEPEPERHEAKYKNSPETTIYSKRRTLYGLNWAKDEIIRSGEIIVCEGYTDVIAFFGAGLERAVATCGTALGEDHFRTMKNFASRIVLAYDADSAGQSAAASVYQWEKQHQVDVFVARLPRGSDPADLARKDPEALRASVANALPFLQFRLERVLDAASLATAEGRARAADAAMAVIAEHPNDLVRDQYVMTVADRLRVEANALRAGVDAVRRGETPAPAPRRAAREGGSLPRPALEALRLLVHQRDLVEGRLIAAMFDNEVQRDVFEGLETDRQVSMVVDQLSARGDADAADLLARLVVDELGRTYSAADAAAVIAQLLRAASQRELREIERDLRSGVMSPQDAHATVRDVKERLLALEGDQGAAAEVDLREWLLARHAVTRP